LFTKSKKSNLTKIKDSKVVENMEEVRGEGKWKSKAMIG